MKPYTYALTIAAVMFLAASCNPFSKPAGGGVIKTVNGGADWQFSNAMKNVKNGSLATLNVSRIMLDPGNRETVYVGGYNGGLYKSEDSGTTWTRILSKIFVYDFAIHPSDSKTIYAAGFYDGHGRVLYTKDGGATWQEVYNEASADNPVWALALNPSNPSQLAIGTGTGAIITSSDAGLSWRLWKNLEDRVSRIAWQGQSVYVLAKTKGLYQAAALGGDLTTLTKQLTGSPTDILSDQYAKSFNQMYIDPVTTSLMYVTTDRGLYKSTDGGKNWNYLKLPVQGGQANARAIAVSKSSSNVVFTSVGATVYKSVDGGQNFQTQSVATNGFINYILIDPQLPQIAYGGIYVQGQQ